MRGCALSKTWGSFHFTNINPNRSAGDCQYILFICYTCIESTYVTVVLELSESLTCIAIIRRLDANLFTRKGYKSQSMFSGKCS